MEDAGLIVVAPYGTDRKELDQAQIDYKQI